MSVTTAPNRFTADQYADTFARAKALQYATVAAFEQRMGYCLSPSRLHAAAYVLCCPIKAKLAHWQHGRVLYAAARKYLETHEGAVRVLDIGTAKGFSALCLQWALVDADRPGLVTSVDVMPPDGRVYRNSIAELDGLKTLPEILAPWPESRAIVFVESTGIEWLGRQRERVHVAFVDGKHTAEVVYTEGKLLAARQQPGDVVIFDDCQMSPVLTAVERCAGWYRVEYLRAEPRVYGIAVRR